MRELQQARLRRILIGPLIYSTFVVCGACPEPVLDSNQSLGSSQVMQAIEDDALKVIESGPTYTIYDAGVKRYGKLTALVQSSKTPISLGTEMRPFMDTQRFWAYFRDNGFSPQKDSPEEIYVYNWVEKAQGKMVFDVGIPVGDMKVDKTLPDWLQIKSYQPMKVASLVYVGPFPHQEDSGWEEIRWEDRAREKGCVYDERVYRELYHKYDFQTNQHITEVQISIE